MRTENNGVCSLPRCCTLSDSWRLQEDFHLRLRLQTFILKCRLSEIRFIQLWLWLWTEAHMVPVTWRVTIRVRTWSYVNRASALLGWQKKKACLEIFLVSPLPVFYPCTTLYPPKSAATGEDPGTDKEEKKINIKSIPAMDPERLVVKNSPGPFESLKIFVLHPEMVIDWNCLWF